MLEEKQNQNLTKGLLHRVTWATTVFGQEGDLLSGAKKSWLIISSIATMTFFFINLGCIF